jgi:photosystem II stability/assembly factor-like uncharacterized protein
MPEVFRHGVFVSATAAWLLTTKGVIWSTTDSGETWIETIIETPEQSRTTAIDFIDRQTGWAADVRGGVWKTTNGGKSWVRAGKLEFSNGASGGPVERIQFVDARYGWAIEPWVVWRSTNGGSSWQYEPIYIEEDLGLVHRGRFVSRTDGWVIGDRARVLRTSDGGKTFREQTLPAGSDTWVNSVFSTDGTTAWIVASPDGGIYYTNNRGENWLRQEIPNPDSRVLSVHFIDTNEGWAVGWEPRPGIPNSRPLVLHTPDGGASWETVKTAITEAPFQVFFSDIMHGWIVCPNLLYRTADGGKTWREVLRIKGRR